MSFRPPELVIAPDDPFKEDTLSRKPQVEALCGVIETDERPVVVSVDGRFGSGKSTFLAMCAAHLRMRDVAVAEFNAWQHSHTKNPLIDLTSALMSEVPRSEALKRVATGIGWAAVSAITHGAMNRQNFQDGDVEPLFDLWSKIEKHRQEFHEELKTVVEANQNRLVIFIDELDRCVPQQALDCLNIARHLFDVPGVAVVVGVNQEELAHRVRQLYGERCSADVYLQRFWDFTLPLREPDSEQLTVFLNGVFQGAEVSDRLSAADDTFMGAFWRLLVNQSGMSLRDIQQKVHYLARVLANIPMPDRSGQNPFGADETPAHLVLAAFAMRIIDRDGYDKLVSNEYSPFEAAASFRQKLNLDVDVANPGHYLMALVLCLNPYEHIGVRDEVLVERFVNAGAGDADLGAAILRMCEGIRPRVLATMPSLEHIDSLLSLTR